MSKLRMKGSLNPLEIEPNKAIRINSYRCQHIRRRRIRTPEISHRLPQRERASKFHIHKRRFPGNKIRLESGSQAEWIVHLKGSNTISRAKDIKIMIQHLPHQAGYPTAILSKRIHLFATHLCYRSNIERNQAYGPAPMQDNMRCMRIRKNIELSSGRI